MNIMNIAESIAGKFGPAIESGDFDINELLKSAQNAMGQIYQNNNMSQDANPLNNMLTQLMGNMENMTNKPDESNVENTNMETNDDDVMMDEAFEETLSKKKRKKVKVRKNKE